MKLIREPLLHFLVIGGLLFAVYSWLRRGDVDEAPVVRITASEVAWLKETWSRQWQREPSREELRGLVTDFLKEELLAREARAMRLDEDDTIVRRRLAQKVAFLVEDTTRLAEPTEQDLRRFYDAHPEHFQNAARVSFTHIFFSREKHADAEADVKLALAELARGASPETLGDQSLLDAEMTDAEEKAIAAQFGPDFAQAVLTLKPGVWSGPVVSGYGLHLVRVSSLTPGRRREFAGLLKKYHVAVDENVKPLIGPLDGPLPAPQAGEGAVR